MLSVVWARTRDTSGIVRIRFTGVLSDHALAGGALLGAVRGSSRVMAHWTAKPPPRHVRPRAHERAGSRGSSAVTLWHVAALLGPVRGSCHGTPRRAMGLRSLLPTRATTRTRACLGCARMPVCWSRVPSASACEGDYGGFRAKFSFARGPTADDLRWGVVVRGTPAYDKIRRNNKEHVCANSAKIVPLLHAVFWSLGVALHMQLIKPRVVALWGLAALWHTDTNPRGAIPVACRPLDTGGGLLLYTAVPFRTCFILFRGIWVIPLDLTPTAKLARPHLKVGARPTARSRRVRAACLGMRGASLCGRLARSGRARPGGMADRPRARPVCRRRRRQPPSASRGTISRPTRSEAQVRDPRKCRRVGGGYPWDRRDRVREP